MANPAQVIRQMDFSGGELIEHAKRGDDAAIMRSGARKMRNWRILNSRSVEIRPGRSPLFAEPGRTDEVRMNSATIYRFSFGDGTLRIRDANGTFIAGQAGFPWSLSTISQVTWALVNFDVVICFPGMKPKVARWDGVATWTFLDYTFRTGPDGLPRVPFSRIATKGITMTPGAVSGSTTVQFSDNVLIPAHVGSVFQWANKKIKITAVTDGKNGTGLPLETLLPCQRLTVPAGNENGFAKGDVVIGGTTNANGEVVSIDTVNHFVFVQNLTLVSGFTTSDTIVGPNGRSTVSAQTTVAPQATATWTEQVISDARGWPQSVSTDVNRIIFCDLPGVPEGIIWSAIGIPDDLQIGINATDAFMEVMTGKPRVYHVIGGQDEFVFTNKGVRYIPISASNPLKPGSVQFLQITPDAAAQLRPVQTAEGVLFMNEGKTRVIALLQTGQNTAPYTTMDVSQYHAHLIKSPIALAVSTGDGEFPERYVYVLNNDGTMAVGRYERSKDWLGFTPWDSRGFLEWVSVLASRVLVTTRYQNGATPVHLVENLSSLAYLDGSVPLNAIPAPLAAGTGAAYQVFPNAGTDIGNMTGSGGTAAAHDGVTSKTAANCAAFAGSAGWVGYALPVAQPIDHAELWPSSDNGFCFGEGGNITLELRGKATATSTGADGVLLGSVSVPDTTTGPIIIASSDKVTTYPFVWVRVINLSASNCFLAQSKIFHPGPVQTSMSGGTGALWFYSGGNVDLMDGLNPRGSRAVNTSGDIVPQNGEDLSSPTLNIGFTFTSVLEPFVPNASSGQDVGQTTKRRGIKKTMIVVQNSTGFVYGNRRVAPWRQGENGGVAPPQREETLSFRPLGRSFDPRIALVKDTPGTLRVLEIAHQVNV